MPSKCFASWASPNWTRPPRRRDKNRSCSDQPQNPPPYLLGVTGHNVKHALVAVGAVAALLVVSFAHRRSPLPAGLQGAEKVGQEVPLSKPQLTKARRKRMAQAVDRHHLAKSQVTAKMAAEVKSLAPSSRAKVAIGKVSLASSQQRLSSPHSKSSSETDFVAKDTVTHDG